MLLLRWIVAGALLAAVGTAVSAQQLLRPYPHLVDFPYEVVPNFFKPNFPAGWDWGTVSSIYVESPDRILVATSGILPKLEQFVGANGWPATRAGGRQSKLNRREFVVTIYDRNGNRVEHWQEFDKIGGAHSIKVDPSDPEKHIFFIGAGEYGVLKYTRDGKRRVWAIGEDEATGCPGPQDISFLPNGDFWCLTGDPSGLKSWGVRKFTKDGKLVAGSEFASKPGNGPYEFNAAHAIIIDRQGRILVSDRGNYRTQVYDQNGKFIATWPNNVPRSFAIDARNRLWVVCGEDNCGKGLAPHSFSAHDLSNGRPLFNWGVAGGLPGEMYYNGQFDVDSEGSLYMGEVGGGRVQKWRPRAGANRDHLIAYPIVR